MRLLCAIGLHNGWHEHGRLQPDPLGIVTAYERCRCGNAVRELWIDAVSGRVFRTFRA